MNLLDIILLAIALAMDCFTVSIVSGVILMTQRDGSFVTPADVTKEPSLCVIRITPLTMETVKQSIAKATAKRMISSRFISYLFARFLYFARKITK